MATCKDCIHYEACKKHGHLKFTANDLYELMYQNGVEKSCHHFKNKADFVEVVRCKDCIYKEECLQKVDCEYQYREIVFCSYGVKKDKNDFKE